MMPRRKHAAVSTRVWRNEWVWAPCFYTLALAVLYWPLIVHKLSFGFGWDTVESYWPDLAAYTELVSHGTLPLWNPYEKGGNPFFAVADRALFYPLNWIWVAVGTAIGDVPWWLGQVKQLTHHLIAALTMHAFIRSRDLPQTSAVASSLAWLACTPMFLHKASGVLWPLAWVPLVWLCIDRCVTKPTWRRAAALAAALFVCGSSGSPPGFFYSLLLALPYAAWRGGAALIACRDNRVALAKHLCVAAVITGAIATALLWVYYAPIAELTELSQRAERSLDYALSNPLAFPDSLVGMVSPYAGSPEAYVGLITLTLGFIAIATRPKHDSGIAWVFWVLAGLFYSLAIASELLRFAAEHVPGFGLFRAANRYKLLVAPLLCVAAGYGLAAIQPRPNCRRRNLVPALIATSVLTIAIAMTWAFASGVPKQAPPEHSANALLGGAIVLMATMSAVRTRWAQLALPALLALLVFDSYQASRWRGQTLWPQPTTRRDTHLDAVRSGADPRWRIYDEFVLGPRLGSRQGLREFRGYPGGGSLEYQRYARILRFAEHSPQILEAYNMGMVLFGPHAHFGNHYHHLQGPPHQTHPDHYVARGQWASQSKHPMPRVVWVAQAVIAGPGDDDLLRAVLATEDPQGQRNQVVVEPGDAASVDHLLARNNARAKAVTGRILRDSPNRLVATIDAPQDGIVMINDAMYPGWRVRVDDVAKPALYINGFARGVVVERGIHTLEWRFRPSGHGLRLLAFWIAILVVILAAVPRRKRYLQTV